MKKDSTPDALTITLKRTVDDVDRWQALERVCDLLLKGVEKETSGSNDLEGSTEPEAGCGAALESEPTA